MPHRRGGRSAAAPKAARRVGIAQAHADYPSASASSLTTRRPWAPAIFRLDVTHGSRAAIARIDHSQDRRRGRGPGAQLELVACSHRWCRRWRHHPRCPCHRRGCFGYSAAVAAATVPLVFKAARRPVRLPASTPKRGGPRAVGKLLPAPVEEKVFRGRGGDRCGGGGRWLRCGRRDHSRAAAQEFEGEMAPGAKQAQLEAEVGAERVCCAVLFCVAVSFGAVFL